MAFHQPWSKRHKEVTRGTRYNLSNSFAEPLTNETLIRLTLERGDHAIIEAYHKHDLAYTPNGGSLDLREEIARLYGHRINAEHIVVCPGGQVALQTAAIALQSRDSHAIVFTPGYQSVQHAPVHAGSHITVLERYPENHWHMDLKAVEAAIQGNTTYLIINEPYNPAGRVMSREQQQQLRDIAIKNDLYVLSDEVYRLLEHDANDRLPAMADLYAKGISVGALSKPWGGCGITIGWLALQDLDLKQQLIDTLYFGTACPSRASELQAIMTLRASDVILEERLTIIQHNLTLLDAFFDDYRALFDWVRPNAGTIAFVTFKGPLRSDVLGERLAQAGISIKPAYVFTGDNTRYQEYFRIGFGEATMPVALQALIDFVEGNKHAW